MSVRSQKQQMNTTLFVPSRAYLRALFYVISEQPAQGSLSVPFRSAAKSPADRKRGHAGRPGPVSRAQSVPVRTAQPRSWIGAEGLPVVIKPFDKRTTHDMMDTATKCCKFVLEPPRSLFGEFDSIQVCPSTKLLKFL